MSKNKVHKSTFDASKMLREQHKFIECFSHPDKSLIKTLFRFYKGHYKNFLLASLFFFLQYLPHWVLPIITANIIDIATNRPENAVTLFVINAIIGFLVIAQNSTTWTLFISFRSKATRSVEAGLRGAMIRKLQALSISFHKEFESGKIHTKIIRDVEAIEAFSSSIFYTLLASATQITISLSIVVTKNIYVFLMFLLCVPVAVSVTVFFRKKMRTVNHDFRKEMENTSSNISDMEELIPVTRAHALERFEIKKVTSSITKIAQKGYVMDKTNAWFGATGFVVFTSIQLICLLFTGIMAFNGKISVGDVTLFQSYFASLVAQVTALVSLMPVITKGVESINSVGEILSSHNVEENHNKLKLHDIRGEFEFRDVHFNYEDDNTPVLKGLDLTVKAGETVALVGESGSGKSTVLNLVIGFNKINSGSLKIDGIDVNEIDMRSYRKRVSLVSQNTILFNGTIRENIAYGSPHLSDEMMDYAIKAARLESVIAKLPDGIDTQIGEHGAKLSGGQRQRISIARAIIRDPKVIIFDEATSALDSQTEREIQEAIDHLTANRTTFIVAHRLSTIKNADKIAFIKDGKCVEFGTYDELMANKGEFYNLKQMQS